MAGGGEGATARLMYGVLGTVAASLIMFTLTKDGGLLNRNEPAILRGSVDAAELASGNPCCSYAVHVTIEGYKGKSCQLQWTLIDVTTGSKTLSSTAIDFKPEADHDEAGVEVPVEVTAAGTYSVRFILYGPNGIELDRADTEVIQVG
jgi:hypothetical protein